MPSKNPLVDLYLKVGCGRCPLGGTAECKVHNWQKELQLLRSIALSCGLTEELKWKVPCYTKEGRNIFIVSALKSYASISFFKGSLLKDKHQILEKPGENCQAARIIKFTSVKAVRELEPTVVDYIHEAVEVEKAGLKVDFKAKDELALPDELQQKFSELPALRYAWERLTPGRKRGYVLYFSAAKQSTTRETRINKYVPWILEGRGMHD